MSFEKLESEILSCIKCPRLRAVTKFPHPHLVFAKSPKDVKLLIVGRNPGLEYSFTGTGPKEFMEFYKKGYMASNFGKYMYEYLGEEI